MSSLVTFKVAPHVVGEIRQHHTDFDESL